MITIGEVSPLVRKITREEAMQTVAELGYAFGHQLNRDMIETISSILLHSNWTRGELEMAAAFIPSDSEMCKEIAYSRTITPAVFALARTKPQVMRGRLFEREEAIDFSAEKGKSLDVLFEPVAHGTTTKFAMR